jgi:hypothetical protein
LRDRHNLIPILAGVRPGGRRREAPAITAPGSVCAGRLPVGASSSPQRRAYCAWRPRGCWRTVTLGVRDAVDPYRAPGVSGPHPHPRRTTSPRHLGRVPRPLQRASASPGQTTTSAGRRRGPAADHGPCRRTGPSTNNPQWTNCRILPGSIGRTGSTSGTGQPQRNPKRAQDCRSRCTLPAPPPAAEPTHTRVLPRRSRLGANERDRHAPRRRAASQSPWDYPHVNYGLATPRRWSVQSLVWTGAQRTCRCADGAGQFVGRRIYRASITTP